MDFRDYSLQEISEAIYELQKDFFIEKPVDIITFLSDSDFLGSIFNEDFYPFWLNVLKTLHPSPFVNAYHEVIAQLPIGSGKSLTSSVSLVYEIYKLLCLKSPQAFYDLKPRTTAIFTALFSATKVLASDVNWSYLSALLSSPWFISRGVNLPSIKSLRKDLMVNIKDDLYIVGGSQVLSVLGHAIIGGVLDEANFQKEKSGQAHRVYYALLRRRESRFMRAGGNLPGIFWLISSPQHSTSFLQRRIESNPPKALILNEVPIYKIKNNVTYSSEVFYVFIGNKEYGPRIITEEEKLSGQYDLNQIYEVPLDYRDAFENDIYEAIRDILGVVCGTPQTFIRHPDFITYAMNRTNPVTREVIVGDLFTFKFDDLSRFLNIDYFKSPENPHFNRFIHFDTGLTRDRFSVAAAYVLPDVSSNTSYRVVVDFILTLQSKSGQEVPFNVVEDFICGFLKDVGYKVKLVTSDQYQSRYLLQNIRIKGIESSLLSVDRNRDAYLLLRGLLYDRRIQLPKHPVLEYELRSLIDDGRKIDHPVNTSQGAFYSKDVSDAVAGAVFSAVENNKFDFYYTERFLETDFKPFTKEDFWCIFKLNETQKITEKGETDVFKKSFGRKNNFFSWV